MPLSTLQSLRRQEEEKEEKTGGSTLTMMLLLFQCWYYVYDSIVFLFCTCTRVALCLPSSSMMHHHLLLTIKMTNVFVIAMNIIGTCSRQHQLVHAQANVHTNSYTNTSSYMYSKVIAAPQRVIQNHHEAPLGCPLAIRINSCTSA